MAIIHDYLIRIVVYVTKSTNFMLTEYLAMHRHKAALYSVHCTCLIVHIRNAPTEDIVSTGTGDDVNIQTVTCVIMSHISS